MFMSEYFFAAHSKPGFYFIKKQSSIYEMDDCYKWAMLYRGY